MTKFNLTQKQYRVLKFIFEEVWTKGRPPTLQELCNRFGFASLSGAHRHLTALEKKKYLTLLGGSRGIQLVWDNVWSVFGINIIGRVPAGKPQLANAEYLGTLTPEDFYPKGEGLFALRVAGDSMKDAGIFPGDFLVVREQPTADVGDIVVAVIKDFDEEITVKRLTQEDGEFYLQPANPKYERIKLNGGKILGKVIKVHRNLS